MAQPSSSGIRWITTLLGAGAVALSIGLAVRSLHAPSADVAAGGADAGTAAPTAARSSVPVSSGDDAGPPLLLSDLVRSSGDEPAAEDSGVGSVLPSGGPVPALPANAPRHVRFGVVLVTYAGAQPPTTGGRVSSRTRDEARILADKLSLTAVQDFQAAVQQGDSGSSEDLGQVKTGILEPAPEYVLFTLPVNGVGGPVDTPRGFWIVKRLE